MVRVADLCARTEIDAQPMDSELQTSVQLQVRGALYTHTACSSGNRVGGKRRGLLLMETGPLLASSLQDHCH